MLKLGVLGSGNLGELHVQRIKEMDSFELVGVYDSDYEFAEMLSSKYNIPKYSNIDELISRVDAVNVVTPTKTHYSDMIHAIRNSKHIFIENPVTHTVLEAKKLHLLSIEADVKVQIGYAERFNPAFAKAKPFLVSPQYIEAHRLEEYSLDNSRGSIVYDIMINDIDIILNTVNSPVKKVRASGVSVINKTPDIVNARIEFYNGCVANITASRVASKNVKKTRFFQQGSSVYVDYLEHKVDLINVSESQIEKVSSSVSCETYNTATEFGIKMQLQNFYNSIVNNTKPEVTIEDSYDTLKIAQAITQNLKGIF